GRANTLLRDCRRQLGRRLTPEFGHLSSPAIARRSCALPGEDKRIGRSSARAWPGPDWRAVVRGRYFAHENWANRSADFFVSRIQQVEVLPPVDAAIASQRSRPAPTP